MNKPRGRGRPAGETGARDAILDVGRRRFLAEGYDAVSLRSIADEAGVDVALISYHFGSKKGLFGAALALRVNPAEVLGQVLSGPRDTAPERLVATILAVWDDPATGPSLRLLAQEALRDAESGRLFREVVQREMLPALAAFAAPNVGAADARYRAGLAATVITGLIMNRYLLGLEPVASMPADELVPRLAPLLRYALGARRPPSRL